MPRLFLICTTLVIILVNLCCWAIPANAAGLVVHAVVPARATDFQLALQGPPQTTVHQGADLRFKLIYGSKLSTQTDVIALQLSWSQGFINNDPTQAVDILQYIVGTATLGLGKANPQISTGGRHINWSISPMPPGTDYSVAMHLLTIPNYTGPDPVYFTITARLIGPGIELPPQKLTLIYIYQPGLTPTPAGTISSPTPTPNSSRPTSTPTGLTAIIWPTLDPAWLTWLALILLLIGVGILIRRQLHLTTSRDIITWLSLWPWFYWAKQRWWWGQVFNQQHQPLAGIKLRLVREDGLIHQGMTTRRGRFGWRVSPGSYYLSIDQPEVALDRSSHTADTNWYNGGQIVVKDQAPRFNIATISQPLTLSNLDWSLIILTFGLGLAIIGLMFGPSLFGGIVLGLYLFSWVELVLN